MDGLVDLHTHSLPGVDDGSENLEESIRMLKGLRERGFTRIFLTPHHRLDTWKGIATEVVLSGVKSLQAAASQRGLDVRLYPGVEYDLDENLDSRVLNRPGKGGYVLVDMGFWDVPEDLEGLLARVREAADVKILLAHPERNRRLCQKRDLIDSLIRSGVLLTGNLGSLAGYYGKQIRKDSRRLLKEGKYWAMASDLHSPEMLPWIGSGLDDLEKLAGRQKFRELLCDHPVEVVGLISEGNP